MSITKSLYKVKSFLFDYSTPANLSHLWNFGVLSLFFLILQILTGIFLAMHYVADETLAFLSVEDIMRNVSYGWLIRYMHANVASFFFFCVFIHIARNLYYVSYEQPRSITWNIGVIIFILMIVAAFTGYVLPWGQMSFWAATVITNLFSAIPICGEFITYWLWGGYSVNSATLTRFFTFHFLVPFIILFLVILHIVFLHEVGSSNKLGVFLKFDKIFFHPYFTIKDIFVITLFLLVLFIFIGYMPNYLGHPDNYIPANPLSTPAHIVPEWYFLIFYAILRSIPSKIGGVLILFLSLLVLLVFHFFISNTWIKQTWEEEIHIYYLHPCTEERPRWIFTLAQGYNPEFFKQYGAWLRMIANELFKKWSYFLYSNSDKILYWFFIVTCILLAVIGGKPIEYPYLMAGRILTVCYFLYFFILVYSNRISAMTKDIIHINLQTSSKDVKQSIALLEKFGVEEEQHIELTFEQVLNLWYIDTNKFSQTGNSQTVSTKVDEIWENNKMSSEDLK